MMATPCSAHLRSALLILPFSIAAVSAASDAKEPLGVFVTAMRVDEVSRPAKDELKRVKQDGDTAEKSAKQLKDRLAKEHGKDQALWPEEQRALLRTAANALGEAELLLFYDKPNKQEDLDDSAANLKETIQGKGLFHGKKETIRLVPTAEDAQLVVEVIARKKTGLAGPAVRRNIAVRLSAGGRLAPGALARLKLEGGNGTYNPFDNWGDFTVYRFPTAEKPTAVFESSSSHYWSTAAGVLGKHVAGLIEANYDLLHAEENARVGATARP